MCKTNRIPFFIVIFLCCYNSTCPALDLHIAVAANFVRPMEKLSYIFEGDTGVQIKATYASTGKLYAMIKTGAPIDLFLAADEKRPMRLFEEGLAQRPIVYAKGRVVLWAPRGSRFCQRRRVDWREILKGDEVRAIGMASPASAPYGESAEEALKEAGVLGLIRPKLVYAQSIAQSFQYAHMGVVDCSFVALSDALSPEGVLGCHWEVPEAPPVIQAACVLRHSRAKEVARGFVKFLTTPRAKAIMNEFGYE